MRPPPGLPPRYTANLGLAAAEPRAPSPGRSAQAELGSFDPLRGRALSAPLGKHSRAASGKVGRGDDRGSWSVLSGAQWEARAWRGESQMAGKGSPSFGLDGGL